VIYRGTMELEDTLQLVRAANASISTFLEKVPVFSHAEDRPAVNLAGIQDQVTSLTFMVQRVGQCLAAVQLSSLDSNARTEIDLYGRNLNHLRQTLTALRAYAEHRRDQLAAHFRKINEVLAWCDAVKLSSAE
jgi:hypothetical protein